MMRMLTLTTMLAASIPGMTPRGPGKDDRAQILEHIHGIFRAFIERDRAAIESMHAPGWVGFLGPSRGIERGRDAYMRNAEISLENFEGTGYELLDTEVWVRGDTAVVFYVARYDYRDSGGREGSLPLRSIDIYCKAQGQWNQCGSHITPIPREGSWGEADSGRARELSETERADLLAVRERVWRSWFAGDRQAMARLLPEEVIAIDPEVAAWGDRDEITRRSEEFVRSGARLVRLEFPRTRIQAYGDVAVLYTEFSFDTALDDEITTLSGRGTEIFVKRDGRWRNSGWHLDSGR